MDRAVRQIDVLRESLGVEALNVTEPHPAERVEHVQVNGSS
ncbi:MAG TPA: hypothetical protein VLA87_04785 [Gaiellaceae bacterium]|nr:hypothetical protein [Gaiellaceae bacterium]